VSDPTKLPVLRYVPRLEAINTPYADLNPNNCPVIEETADRVKVGVCTFFMRDGKTCPRHGKVRESCS